MKDKRPFKETAVGKWLKTNFPAVLDRVDDHIPFVSVITAAVKGSTLSDEKKIEFEALIQEYEQSERRDYLADTQNARNLQIEALKQEDKLSKRYLYYLSSFVIVAATGFGIMLFFVDFPESNRRLIEMFADIYLFSGAIMVLQFFLGSSRSSQDKDHTIRDLKTKF